MTSWLTSDLYAVVLHANEKAGGELGSAGPGVEESGRGVSEPSLGHQVVALKGKRERER